MHEAFKLLGGRNAIEYQQNLGMYIHQLKQMQPEKRTEVFMKIWPRNIQEDLSFVKILLVFNVDYMLSTVVHSSQWILIKVIIQNEHFLKYITKDNDFFLNETCRNISYNCRTGILRNLGKVLISGQDKFYHKIYKKYGKNEANLILTACSEDLIKRMHDRFTDREMIRMYKRFGFRIMNWYYELDDDYVPGNTVIKFLVERKDAKGILALLKYNKKLGKKGIILLLKTNKLEFINNPRKYQKWKRLIYRYLNLNEWMIYFKNLFPLSEIKFSDSDDIYNNLMMMPLHGRFHALSTGYQDVYKDEIDISAGSKLLMAIPIDKRMKFIMRNDPMLGNSVIVSSTTLCNINACTDINYRVSMYKVAVLNCKINNDKATLQNILNHITTKGLNFSFPIREAVLLALREHFKLLDLNQKHWDCVKTIINGFKEKNETFFDRVYFTEVDLINSVRAGETDCTLLNKYLMEGGCYRLWSLDKVSPFVQRKIATMMGQLINKEYTNQMDLVVDFLSFLEDYNRKRRKTRISYYAYSECLKVLLKRFGDEGNFYYARIVESVLCYQPENFHQEQLQIKLWKQYLLLRNPQTYSQRVIINILVHNPRIITEFAPRIKKNIFSEYKFFFQCAKMHYTNVDKNFDNICMKCYQRNFKSDIELYLNDSNENNTNMEYAFYKRCYFYSLTTTPVPYFKLAMKYVKRDFSMDVSAITTNLLRKVPMNEIETGIIPIYYTTPLISLRKVRSVIEYNTNCDYTQRIKTAINCFMRDPSDEYLKLLKRVINPLLHEQVLKLLHRFHKIPKEKFLDYARYIWSDERTHTANIADHLSIPMLLQLPDLMIQSLFRKLFQMDPTQRNTAFICAYIKKEKNFHFFFQSIQSTNWQTYECTRFMVLLCQEFMQYKDSKNMGELANEFLNETYCNRLPAKIRYQYRIFIELVQSYVLHAFEIYVREKHLRCYDVCNGYNTQLHFGYEALYYFSKYVKAFLTILPTKAIEIRVKLAKRLIEESKSSSCGFLSICLLPLDVDKHGFGSDVKSITEKVMKVNDQILRDLVKNYINSCHTN